MNGQERYVGQRLRAWIHCYRDDHSLDGGRRASQEDSGKDSGRLMGDPRISRDLLCFWQVGRPAMSQMRSL